MAGDDHRLWLKLAMIMFLTWSILFYGVRLWGRLRVKTAASDDVVVTCALVSENRFMQCLKWLKRLTSNRRYPSLVRASCTLPSTRATVSEARACQQTLCTVFTRYYSVTCTQRGIRLTIFYSTFTLHTMSMLSLLEPRGSHPP